MPPGSAAKAGTRVLKGGPSKLRGVIWHKSNGKWEARIYEAGKQRFLGYFTSEVSAAKAYDARAVQLHGSTAKVNFPEDHYETRNNPPAVKSFCALSIPTPTKEEELPPCKTRSNPWGSGSSANRRTAKRKGSNADEDYVLPLQSRSQKPGQQYSLRRSTQKKINQSEFYVEEDSDSEESLEKGAVEVLANLWSSSDQDGSWRSSTGSAVKWNVFGDANRPCRASSPPTASTGASPAPAQKQGVWTPPLFVQRGSTGSLDSYSQPLPTLQNCLNMKGLQSTEDFAESHSLSGIPKRLKDSDSSSDSEQVSANLAFRGSARLPSSASQFQEEFLQPAKGEFRFDGPKDNCMVASELCCTKSRSSDAVNAQHKGRRDPVQSLSRAPSIAASSLPSRSQEKEVCPRNCEQAVQIPVSSRAAPAFTHAPKPTRGSSRYRGVSWCEKGQKWRALLWDGSRQHFLGHFKSEEEGARAYDRALLTRRKKDGFLNFPLSDYQDVTDQNDQLSPPQGGLSTGVGQAPKGEPSAMLGSSPHLENCRGSTTKPLESDFRVWSSPSAVPPMQENGCSIHMQQQAGSGQISSPSCTEEGTRKKWKAEIRMGSQAFALGSFEDKQSAVQAYNEAIARYCLQRGPQASPPVDVPQRYPQGEVVPQGPAANCSYWTGPSPTNCMPKAQPYYTLGEMMSSEQFPVSNQSGAIPNGWGQKRRRYISPA